MRNNLFPEQINSSDDSTLLDVWRILVRYKFWVIGSVLFAMLGALALLPLVRPVWEAKAVVQVGRVGQTPQLVEPVAQAVERMQLGTFQDSVLSSLGDPTENGDSTAQLYRTSLKVSAVPYSDLISITVRGYSADQTAKLAEATVAQLKNKHQELALPAVKRLNEQLSDTEEAEARVRAELERLYEIRDATLKSGDKDFAIKGLMISGIVAARENQLRELQQRDMSLQEQLDPLRTFPTSLIEPINVTDQPVLPKKTPTVLLAGVAGLLAGILVAFFLNGIRPQ